MREIKFRGLVEKSNEWIYGSLTYSTESDNCYIGYFNDSNMYIWENVHTESVGQYTGLKDKNGVEIYESDVVKVIKSESVYKTEIVEVIFEVKMYEGIWNCSTTWIEDSFGAGAAEDCSCEVISIEVLGNIYKNPELLK